MVELETRNGKMVKTLDTLYDESVSYTHLTLPTTSSV